VELKLTEYHVSIFLLKLNSMVMKFKGKDF